MPSNSRRSLAMTGLVTLAAAGAVAFWWFDDREAPDARRVAIAMPAGQDMPVVNEVANGGSTIPGNAGTVDGSASANIGLLRTTGARFWLVPFSAGLESVASAAPGDPDAEMWHRALVSYCHRETLAQSDTARIDRLMQGTGRGDHWVRDDPQLRARLAQVLQRQREFCNSIGRIPKLTELWGRDWAQRADDDQGSINAMLLSIHQSDDPEAKARGLDALGGIDGVWNHALTSPSPTTRLSALQVLVGTGTGPFADLNRVIDGGFGGGLDPYERGRRLQMVAAEVFVCRRFGHCGPASLIAQRQATIGRLEALNGLEALYRSEWASRDWEAIERLVARLSVAEAQRGAGRGP